MKQEFATHAGVSHGLESIKPGESVPVMQAFIEYSAAHSIQPDFISLPRTLVSVSASHLSCLGPV